MRISDWSSDVCSSDLVLEDSALVVIGASNRQMEVFKFEHFRPTEQKIVVTSADPERRVVWSLNAEPAAEEYARLIGSTMEDLTPEVFAANPLLVRIGGEIGRASGRESVCQAG